MIGKLIKGRYEVVDQIGEGGMGVVLRAMDKTLQRPVAIKMLHPTYANEMLKSRFQVEALVTARLNHHCIVTLFDFFEEEEKNFLVMELIEGKTGKDLMDEYEKIPFQILVRIFRRVIEGLAYAHRHGIIHRDIKPNNIMISNTDEIKIMDFGIARQTEGPRMTQIGFTVGSALYMSPEQIKNQNVDNRSDIYSLGITMFEMATGRAPFQDTNASEYNIMIGHLTQDLPKPSIFNPDIPEFLEKAIIKATHKNPDDRFQTMEEFGKALEEGEDATKVSQAVVSARPESQQPVSKRSGEGFFSRLSLPLVIVVLAGLALGGVLGYHWLGDSEEAGYTSTSKKQVAKQEVTDTTPAAPRHEARVEPVAPPKPLPVKIAKFKAIYMAKGQKTPSEVRDADTLTSEDRYFVAFSPDEDLHVYIAQVDSADIITPIFPNPQFSSRTNPLHPSNEYRFPEKEFFFLGGGPGRERLYVIASRGPNEKLDKIYAELISADEVRVKELSRQFIEILNQQEQSNVRTVWFWHG